ncbi:CerR family C-terminal domain-containing protein [Niveibacterium umoris]|uniref:AcrR family transcriptional regulator n=1 Tax=Niveibacterium umoris TaxID=1193620 RepID=A0A840BJX5_9RHOO|nr:CerR family C-terminal domain-containing protein [Niveibacterium umoris]MBB4013555.1 AcrR family transcriptional regulator [Niveibacterium umoris]
MPSTPTTTQRTPPGEETRTALLAAATVIFIEEGFRAARVQDIAQRAGVRLSAINYHFGGKDGLYRAVLQHHAELAVSRTPFPPPDPTHPHAAFEAAVRTLVRRFLDPASESRIAALMLRELVNPTEALGMMIERFTRPQMQQFRPIVAAVLGPRASEEQVARAMFSVLSQCMGYISARPLVERLMPVALAGDDLVERIAAHITHFSWGGLIALRDALENPT